jgi:hypothetical protein
MKLFAIAAAIIAGLLAQPSGAMPAWAATMTIEGTIQKISWHPDKIVKGQPGKSGSAGNDRTIPAHYMVTLQDTKVTPKGNDQVPFESGKTIEIMLNHPKDDNFLKQNMKVRIVDFKMIVGDAVQTSFKGIEILDGNEKNRANPPNSGAGK